LKALIRARPVLPTGTRPVSEPSGTSARRNNCPAASRPSPRVETQSKPEGDSGSEAYG
jgi:hypothetical protein